jgi:carbon-monoxide dehydrogenase large subunit
VTRAELALDKEGTFLGLRVHTQANMGAYLSTFAPCVPTYLYATLLSGVYSTPAIYAEVKAVFTHTVPVDAYRGAGRPEATYLLERLVDVAARQCGFDKIELRRRNFIATSAFPYQTPVALQYDSGDYFSTLNQALETAGWAGFEARRTESAARGKLRGIGISTYLEACGIAPSAVVGSLGARAGLYEVGTIRVHPTGSITVLTGAHSHGQGHETTFAQLVCDKLGVPVANVDIVHGDTAKVPFGMGTYGSRSLAMDKAMDKIIAKGKRIAAHLMEAAVEDIEFDRGTFRVAGTDKIKALAEISLAAYVPHNFPHDELEPGLEETAFYDPKNFTYPGGCHIAEVEIEKETGKVTLLNFTAVDDVGRVVNPMIVEGQVQGGIAQGVGQALLENCIYDSAGQLISASMMDYTMPRADDLAPVSVATHTTLCTHNPLGVKGCGEVGAIGSPPAVINAVVDALRDYGVNHIEMPATAPKIWSIIHGSTH